MFLSREANTAIFYMLRNYELKDEMYYPIIFMIDKNDIFCIIIRRRKEVYTRLGPLVTKVAQCLSWNPAYVAKRQTNSCEDAVTYGRHGVHAHNLNCNFCFHRPRSRQDLFKKGDYLFEGYVHHGTNDLPTNITFALLAFPGTDGGTR